MWRKNDQKTNTQQKSPDSYYIYSFWAFLAPLYDVLSDIFTLGLRRLWKIRFMKRLAPSDNTKLIDMAGGTGAIAFTFLDYVKANKLNNCHVTVCDINESMLETGKTRSKYFKYDPALIEWSNDNATKTSFEDAVFDAYTIGFGIRNCGSSNIEKVLAEAYRILKPGGKFFCMESSQVENNIIRGIINSYMSVVLYIFSYLTGQGEAHNFLIDSMKTFPDQETFKKMIEEAGFRNVQYENFLLGAVTIHYGFKK